MEFDLIISNPPYGKIGANITEEIINEVEYKEFINLLPLNDYTKWNDIYKNLPLEDVEIIEHAFDGDATVTTSLGIVTKIAPNNMSKEKFEILNYSDKDLLNKYFEKNISQGLLDVYNYDHSARRLRIWNPETTFVFNDRVAANDKPFPMAKSDDNAEYLWNRKYLEDSNFEIDYTFFLQYNSDRATKKGKTENHFCGIIFDDATARKNLTKFIYSELGNAFMTRVLKAMHKNGWVQILYWFPRHSKGWKTKAWTVEELLIDYGYTENEIKNVIEALTNDIKK